MHLSLGFSAHARPNIGAHTQGAVDTCCSNFVVSAEGVVWVTPAWDVLQPTDALKLGWAPAPGHTALLLHAARA